MVEMQCYEGDYLGEGKARYHFRGERMGEFAIVADAGTYELGQMYNVQVG